MIRERCSCGSEFRTDEPNPIRIWREWRKKHACEPTTTDPDITAVTTSDTRTETVPLGFAPPMHLGRQDTGLEE